MGLGSLVGGIIGGNSQKKAAKKAADTALKTAEMNNQLAREFKAENVAYNAPYANRGNIAGAYINALLGLPGAEYTTQVPQQPAQQPVTQAGPWGLPVTSGPNGMTMANPFGGTFQMGQPATNQPQAVTTKVTPVSAKQAFDTYRNSTGYQFRLGEGMNALNNGYAAQGTLRSGAAMKDFMRYGQNFGSNEFGNYIGYLGGQQATGLAGAGNIAGVGTTALNAMTQNNNNASDARQNAYLVKGQVNANNWQAAGNVLDRFASSFMGGGGF
jgi:hypothetical protein